MFLGLSRRIACARASAALVIATLCAAFTCAPSPAQNSSPTSARDANAARKALDSRDFDTAIKDFQKTLRDDPANLKAELGLASAFRGVHNYNEARRLLDEARRGHPRNAAPLAALGDLDIETESYDQAIEHLRAALALNPNDVESRNRLAVAYKAKTQFPEALAQIEKVLARDPKNALANYTRAQIESDENQDEKALVDVQQVLKLEPNNRLGQLLLGKVLVRVSQGASKDDAAKDCAQAVQVLEPLASDASADSQTIYLLSHAYQCAGDSEKAQKSLAEFEAASQAERKKKDDQMQVKHLVEQANELAMKNDLQGSLGAANQALAVDPHCGPAYSQLAKLYYSAGDLAKAGEAITRALETDPYQPEFLYVQGKVLEKGRELDKALESFERATLVNPNESDAFFEMGVIYQQQNDRLRALAAFKKAVALSPDDPDYARALAALTGEHSTKP